MNKKEWLRPLTEVQQFEANEYVAACGDTEYGVYKFKCDAPGGPLYAEDSDGLGYSGANYSPCAKTHEAPINDVFVDGYIDYNGNRRQDDGEAVIVWLEYGWKGYWPNRYWGVTNGHATSNLDRDSWEVTKS